MARRSDHSRDEIREMALSAVEGLVAEKGYEYLSARKVAAAIGYTVGTLYLVFENLDDLILQVNARTLDRLNLRMMAAAGGIGDDRKRLMALGQAYIRFAEDDPHLWEMVFKHRLPSDRTLPAWYQEKVWRMFAQVERCLKPIAGHRTPGEIAQAARALWGGVHGICILAVTGKLGGVGVESVPDLAESLLSNYLDGFTGSRNQ